jgi:hypothetical protein
MRWFRRLLEICSLPKVIEVKIVPDWDDDRRPYWFQDFA